MENTTQKQNPYDVLDQPEQTQPVQQTTQNQVQQVTQTQPIQNAQAVKQKTKWDEPGKFIDGLIGFVAKLMGKPDPKTGKVQQQIQTQPVQNPQAIQAQNQAQNQVQQTTQTPKQTAEEILGGVGNLLSSIGNKLEKTADKTINSAMNGINKISQKPSSETIQPPQPIQNTTEKTTLENNTQVASQKTETPEITLEDKQTISTNQENGQIKTPNETKNEIISWN